jgi:hypothetical protein
VTFTDREAFAALLEDFEALFNRTLRPGVGVQYFDALKTFPLATVNAAARELKLKVTRFPSIAEWLTASKAIAAERARTAAPSGDRCEPEAPATWSTTANLVLTFAALAGVKVGDKATRERALEIVNDELRAGVREEFTRPTDVPRARLVDERRRIVALLVRELAGEERPPQEATRAM